MTVAELFINLRVKGGDQASKALQGVDKSLRGIESASIQAKAAVLAVLYAVERTIVSSAEYGANIKVMSEAYGLGAQEIQDFRYAMNLANLSSEQADGSLKGLKQRLDSLRLAGEVPQYLAEAFRRAGITIEDTMPGKIGVVLEKARKLFQQGDVGLNNLLASGLLMSPEVRQALERTKKELSSIHNPYAVGQGGVDALANMEVRWKQFEEHIKSFGRTFALTFGGEMISGLEHAISALERMFKSLDKSKSTLDAMKAVVIAIGVAFAPITTAVAGLIYLLSEWDKSQKRQASIFGEGDKLAIPGMLGGGKGVHTWGGAMGNIASSDAMFGHYIDFFKKLGSGDVSGALMGGGTTINQTNNNYGTPETISKDIANKTKEAINTNHRSVYGEKRTTRVK